MRKFSLELPKYRLELSTKLVRRRKPLVREPLLPSPKLVKKKYRSGSLIGKIARHFSTHRSAKRVIAGNLGALAIVGSLLPSAQAQTVLNTAESNHTSEEIVIQTESNLNTVKAIQFPLEHTRINQGYSYFHPGVDLGESMNAPIKPIKAGEVAEAEYSNYGYGNTVLIDHGTGLTSRYAHLTSIKVTAGEKVTTQTEIGTVGITGHSTGPHLHLEVHQNGRAINPLSILPR
jgi:murein DD-endopeptidase MepM/ murein hydrolase activator NlpD